MPSMERNSRVLILVVSCAVFLTVGMVVSGVGPALPDLARSMGSKLEDVGALFTTLFVGSLLSQAGSGPLADRLGYRPLLIMGLALTGLGMLGVVMVGWLPAALIAMLLAGVGNGMLVVNANVLVSETFAPHHLPALNILNVFFGVGAITGPALASLSVGLWDTALPVLWVAALLMLILIPALVVLRTTPTSQHSAPVPQNLEREVAISGRDESRSSEARGVYRSPMLWALGGLLGLYVGVEVGVGGWATAYIDRTTTLGRESASLVTSGFYMALTGGRLIGAVIGSRLDPFKLMLFSLVGALFSGTFFSLATGNAGLTVASVLLLGLCLGPVYPTTMALTTTAFPFAPGRAVGLIAAMGSLGGAALPWLEGVLLERVSPQAAAIYTAAITLALLAMFMGVRVIRARQTKVPEIKG